MAEDDELESLKRRVAELEAERAKASSPAAPPPPPPPTSTPAQAQAASIGCTLLVLVLILFGFLAMCSGDKKPKKEESACDDEVMAYVMTQDFVRNRLRSPRTAHFPMMAGGEVNVFKSGACEFTVSGYVDAQNAFGAEIRNRYIAVVEAPVTGDTWTAKSVIIE